MDPLVPWLLLLIAGLVLACAAMHSRLREVESTTNARQSLVADELRDAEAGLIAALDRVRRMDQALAERESRLCEPPPRATESAPATYSPPPFMPADARPPEAAALASSAGLVQEQGSSLGMPSPGGAGRWP